MKRTVGLPVARKCELARGVSCARSLHAHAATATLNGPKRGNALAPCLILEQIRENHRARTAFFLLLLPGDKFSQMVTPTNKEYAAFEDKVRRTVYVNHLSPKVTVPVLKTAFAQFGTVINAQFIPNYTESMSIPQRALVEMKTAKQAQYAIADMTTYPFMICGMPRPVRARPAEVEMFADCPARTSRKIQCHWLNPKDSDFWVAKKLKSLTRRHAAEASVLLKHQLQQEKKLEKKQDEVLKRTYKMYEMLDRLKADGSLNRLGYYYNIVPNDRR